MQDLDGFLPAVSKAWSSQWFGDPMAILSQKLKYTKRELIVLNNANGNVHNNVLSARAHLSSILDSLLNNNSNVDLLQQESEANTQLENALYQEEAFLLQKSRVKWLSIGDGNNSFFLTKPRLTGIGINYWLLKTWMGTLSKVTSRSHR